MAFATEPGIALASSTMPTRLHFKPADHVLGDVHPYFYKGECFLYYLKPEEFDHTVGLARSHDLLQWRETPITHTHPIKRPANPDDWMAPWFVLGVFHDPVGQVFRSFYGVRQGRMVSSVSRDLLNWDCAPKEFHVPPGGYYKQRRDPYVFWIPEMKKYGCVMTTWMKDSDWETGGALSLATSPDLKNWTDHGAIIYPGDMGSPECPQMFTLGGHWYALASIHQGQGEYGGVGQPTYWTSKSPLGPWDPKPTGVLDGRHNCAAQVAFDGEIPLLFGWIPMTPTWQSKDESWGGHLALPREIYALPDGTLGSRLPSNLLEWFATLPWQDVPDFTITSRPNTLDGEWQGKWQNFAAEFSLEMPASTKAVRVQIGALGEIVIAHDRLCICDGSSRVISELAANIPSDRPVTVRIFVELNIIEVFVNGCYSLVARVPETTDLLGFSMQGDGSGAKVSAMRISPLGGSRQTEFVDSIAQCPQDGVPKT